MSAATTEVLGRIVKGELLNGDTKEISILFREKTTPQKNAFLNKLGIEVINDKNPVPNISNDKISNSALHSVTKELLIQQASEQTAENSFLRTDYGYLGLSKKLLAEEGRRHPLDEDGRVPDVIVDHLKALLKQAPKALNSEEGTNIKDIARVISFNIYNTYTGVLPVIDHEDLAIKLDPSYQLDLSILEKDSLTENVALESLEALAATLEQEIIIAPPIVAYHPAARVSFSQKLTEKFFGVKEAINKLVGHVESFICDKFTASINLFGGHEGTRSTIHHEDFIEVAGGDAYHTEVIN